LRIKKAGNSKGNKITEDSTHEDDPTKTPTGQEATNDFGGVTTDFDGNPIIQ